MKKFAVSAFVVALAAGSAFAQSPARLDLRIVRQSATNPALPGGSPNGVTDVDANTSFNTTSGVTFRFEVQYRIVDLDANDNIVVAGLSGMQLNITSTSGTLARAVTSGAETTAGVVPPRTFGQPAATQAWRGGAPFVDNSGVGSNPINPLPNNDRRTGLHSPFRGGLADANDNNLPSNGTIVGSSIVGITPLALSQTNQGLAGFATAVDANDDPINVLSGGEWYGLFSFLVTTGGSNALITATAIPDGATGNAFALQNNGVAVPVTSQSATPGGYNLIVPAPGAAALMGLGGLLVARRRRA